MADESVQLIDESRKTGSMFDRDSEQSREIRRKVRDLRERHDALSENAMTSLRAALGDDLTQRMETRLAAGAASTEGAGGTVTLNLAPAAGGAGTVAIAATLQPAAVEEEQDSPSPIPQPISRRDLESIARSLAVTDDQQPTLTGLHDDYMTRFEELRTTQIKALEDAQASQWAADPETGRMRGPSEADVANLYTLRKQVMDAVMALDTGFFDDLVIGLGLPEDSAALKRVRLARERDLYRRTAGSRGGMFGQFGRGGRGGPGGGGDGRRGGQGGGPGGRGRFGMFAGGNESSIDLSRLVDNLHLDSEATAKVPPALVEYETAATDAFRTHYEASVQFEQAMARMAAQTMGQGREGGGGGRGDGERGGGERRGGDFGAGFRELMDKEGKASQDAEAVIRTLNQQSLETLQAHLPAEAAQSLRTAYNRSAFPEVFHDQQAADAQINAALSLPDLSDAQRGQINDTAVEYHGAYDDVCRKMIDLNRQSAGETGQNRDWTAMQQRMQSMEKLQFERNDLNDKVRGKLRTILTEEQAQRIEGLVPQTAAQGG